MSDHSPSNLPPPTASDSPSTRIVVNTPEPLPSDVERPARRTWPQRLTIATALLLAVASFGGAGLLYAGQRIVEDRNIAPEILDPRRNETAADLSADPAADGAAPAPVVTDADGSVVPAPTFPTAEPEARNFLITGADNNSCIDPESPYAPAFGDRSNIGERSDTIMLWRVNPSTSQVAVLSFPRDLYVNIADSSRKGRINEAYERGDPQRLADTIWQNFGLLHDHYIQVDFCAFKTLVDSVDGVAVPFDTPVRDPNTGLNVTTAGCFTFDGDHALAYVRSRKLEYLDEDGEWVRDGTSDLGRISRQQDFLRRTVARLLDRGVFDPDVAGGLIETNRRYVTTDQQLTPARMLEFAGVLRNVDPTRITTYQIEADGATIQGNAVLVPDIDGDNMQSILSIFRGQATLADAPDQVFDTTIASSVAPPVTADAGAGDDGGPAATTSPTPSATTLPEVVVEENVFGVVPDENVKC